MPAVRNLGPLGRGTTENAVYHGKLRCPVFQGAQPCSGSPLLAHGKEDAGHFGEDPRAEAWRDPPPQPLPLPRLAPAFCFKSLAAFQTPGPGDPTVGEPAYFFLEKTS